MAARTKKDTINTEARALVDLEIDGTRIPCGKTFSASPEYIASLAASGQADADPHAVNAGKAE